MASLWKASPLPPLATLENACHYSQFYLPLSTWVGVVATDRRHHLTSAPPKVLPSITPAFELIHNLIILLMGGFFILENLIPWLRIKLFFFILMNVTPNKYLLVIIDLVVL